MDPAVPASPDDPAVPRSWSWLAPLASAGPALSATCSAWEGRVLYWAAFTEVHPAPASVTTGGSSLSQLAPPKKCKPPAVLRAELASGGLAGRVQGPSNTLKFRGATCGVHPRALRFHVPCLPCHACGCSSAKASLAFNPPATSPSPPPQMTYTPASFCLVSGPAAFFFCCAMWLPAWGAIEHQQVRSPRGLGSAAS
jgi:hypothetical protein